MGIISRFTDIMSSNINALLDKCEDPAKMVDQTLRNLREDLADVKKETAAVIADEKAAKRRLDECQASIQRYTAAAQNAVKAGNDDDARTLIQKKQQYENNLTNIQTTYSAAKANADKMRQMHDKLVHDIDALELRKDNIKAKMNVAKAQDRVNKMVSGSRSSEASISAFERMEAKADKMLDAAAASAELNAGLEDSAENLAAKYSPGGSGDVSVEAELKAMKAQISG